MSIILCRLSCGNGSKYDEHAGARARHTLFRVTGIDELDAATGEAELDPWALPYEVVEPACIDRCYHEHDDGITGILLLCCLFDELRDAAVGWITEGAGLPRNGERIRVTLFPVNRARVPQGAELVPQGLEDFLWRDPLVRVAFLCGVEHPTAGGEILKKRLNGGAAAGLLLVVTVGLVVHIDYTAELRLDIEDVML